LSLRDLRADSLHRLLASPRGASALTVEDIPALPGLSAWNGFVLQVAIGDLVAEDLLVDDAYGRLHVEPVGGAAA